MNFNVGNNEIIGAHYYINLSLHSKDSVLSKDHYQRIVFIKPGKLYKIEKINGEIDFG